MSVPPLPPPVDEVDRIASLPDPIIRNLQITQCYQELSVGMAQRTGLRANWCTFATWASKQAGQTIRKEDLSRAFEGMLAASLATQSTTNLVTSAQQLGSKRDATEIQETVWDVLNPFAALDRASDAVGRGNQKVFAEIGREFARFYAICLSDTIFDANHLDEFCAALRPGEPPDGQHYLRRAFTRYYHALFCEDAKTRLEMMLCANLEIGFHEQTRLQPEIAESLNAALIDPKEFRQRLIKAIFPYRGWLARLRLYVLRLLDRPSPFDEAVDALVAEARRQARLLITAQLMTITLPPAVRLQLGQDLTAEYPVDLQQLIDPDLCALLDQIDPTPDSPRESGAVDWADLADRIHFIADLFRCYADCADLFDPPFTPEQIDLIKQGRLPSGKL